MMIGHPITYELLSIAATVLPGERRAVGALAGYPAAEVGEQFISLLVGGFVRGEVNFGADGAGVVCWIEGVTADGRRLLHEAASYRPPVFRPA